MDKLPSGPVVWDGSACLGCRYCMIACPFEIPKYEYASNTPRVRKCSFCRERQLAGLKPACVEVCPVDWDEGAPTMKGTFESKKDYFTTPTIGP